MSNHDKLCLAVLNVIRYGLGAIVGEQVGKSAQQNYSNVQEFSRKILDLYDVDVAIDGLDNLVTGPAVMVMNHTSMLDIPVIVQIPGLMHFAARKDLFRYPIFGQGMNAVGMISIDRSNGFEAKKKLDVAVGNLLAEEPVDNPEDSHYIVIFSEGTRSRTPGYELGRFKNGAFELSAKYDLPLILVASYGAKDLLPPGSLDAKSGTVHVEIVGAMDPKDYLSPEMVESIKAGWRWPDETKEAIRTFQDTARNELGARVHEMHEKYSA